MKDAYKESHSYSWTCENCSKVKVMSFEKETSWNDRLPEKWHYFELTIRVNHKNAYCTKTNHTNFVLCETCSENRRPLDPVPPAIEHEPEFKARSKRRMIDTFMQVRMPEDAEWKYESRY